jgi:hypothetical protein
MAAMYDLEKKNKLKKQLKLQPINKKELKSLLAV